MDQDLQPLTAQGAQYSLLRAAIEASRSDVFHEATKDRHSGDPTFRKLVAELAFTRHLVARYNLLLLFILLLVSIAYHAGRTRQRRRCAEGSRLSVHISNNGALLEADQLGDRADQTVIIYPKDGTSCMQTAAISSQISTLVNDPTHIFQSASKVMGVNYWRVKGLSDDSIKKLQSNPMVASINPECKPGDCYDPTVGVVHHANAFDEMEEYPASGSSSTLFGTATPPDVLTKKIDGFNERSSLLPRPGTRQNRKPHLSSLHAFLMYQPRPIPYLNKALPSNAKSLVVLLFLGINIFYSLFGIAFERTSMFSFADRLGALFAVNLPLLCLLAAKNQPIKKLTGYSYEALNIFHRRVGEMMCFLAVLHMLGMFFWWWDLLRPGFEFTLYDFIFNDLVLPGVGAFFSYELLYLTSLGSFRQRWYEIFLVSHVVLQLAAAIFLWFHYPTSRIWVGISLAIFCIDRLAYRLYLKSATMDATLEVMEDGQTAMLSANWAMPTTPRTRSIAAGWKPTDHVFLTLSSSSWCERLQAHPFTIASAAPNMMGPKPHAWLSLIIRAQDGFSKRLLDLALHQSTIQVRLDGPYGSPRALATLNGSDTAIVIAGGSGIAVAFPLVYALLDPYQNGDPHGTITGEQLGRAKRSVCLVWIVHSRSHVSWLPQERLDELKEWGLELVIPYPTADGGRPNVAEIVQDLVYQHDGTRSAVVVSGPDGMNRDVRNACSRLVREGLDVEVEVEKFGW